MKQPEGLCRLVTQSFRSTLFGRRLMQDLIIEKPYCFVQPPRRSFVLWVVAGLRLYRWWLGTSEGIYEYEVRNQHLIQQSLDAGDSILIASNHCRNADPVGIGELLYVVDSYAYLMASWHLFNQDRFSAWMIKRLGAFSINREGMDKKAISFAIKTLVDGERMLVIYPEGSVSRSNDFMHPFLDGTGFIARTAARKRAKLAGERNSGKVMVHPVAFRYLFIGDFDSCCEHTLNLLETHLKWEPQTHLPLLERIAKVAVGLLSEREVKYLGRAQEGGYYERIKALIVHVLSKQEQKWKGGVQSGDYIARVKSLRPIIVPDLAKGHLKVEEAASRRQDLYDLNFVQQLCYYPVDYLSGNTGKVTAERIIETLERLEEDLTDMITMPRRFKLVIDVLDAVEIPAEKLPRGAENDPVMDEVRDRLEANLALSAEWMPVYEPELEG